MNITAHDSYTAEMMARPFVQKVHDVVKSEGDMTALQAAKKAGYGIALTVTALNVLRDAGLVERDGAVWRAVEKPQTYERRVDENGNEYIVTI